MTSTLIISTYNWPEALALVLKSVSNQKVFPSEVIIADDGSKSDTRILVESLQNDFPVPLIHVWHKDDGFQKATILNKAIAKSIGEYIIQVDGDCILHTNFIYDHISQSEKNTYLYGARVNIQKNHLFTLFSKQQIKFTPLSKGIKKRTRAFYCVFLSRKYKAHSVFSKKYRGCNTSFFKSDFVKVNGYNEEFRGWGREDSELALRFHNNNVLAKRLRYAGIVFHIYHDEKSKSNLEKNNLIEIDTLEKHKKWCENGIDKYLF